MPRCAEYTVIAPESTRLTLFGHLLGNRCGLRMAAGASKVSGPLACPSGSRHGLGIEFPIEYDAFDALSRDGAMRWNGYVVTGRGDAM